MLPRSALTFLLLVLLLCPGFVRAQTSTAPLDSDGVAPAHVAHVEGTAILERDGKPESSPLNMPLLSGDRLKTQDGRVEVLFADGSALHLDARTTLDIQSDDLVRLIDGRLRLAIPGPSRTVAYRIDSPAGSVRISQSGEYRVSMLRGEGETQIELAVIRGGGEIFTDDGVTPVRAGERAYASAGLAPSYAYTYNSANWDAFDRWSESRRDTRMGVSAQYLPEDVRSYGSTLDEYGDWRYQQAYGYVWYPRVATSWRPYYYGRWASYPRYGWTWIGADAFSWPTHHYGRWGVSAGVWFWIPGRQWAPAHVSWAYSPGYVSWCPLGYNNLPVISVNIFNVGPRYYSSSYAWTAVSSSHFGHNYYVHQRAVNWNQWDRRTSWQVGRAAPVGREFAVPRGSTAAAPIRWAGARGNGDRGSSTFAPGSSPLDPRPSTRDARASNVAVPRNDGRTVAPGTRADATPRYINRGDAIVRSQTERPSGARAGSIGSSVAGSNDSGPIANAPGAASSSPVRGDFAVARTAPVTGARGDTNATRGVAASPRRTDTASPLGEPSRDSRAVPNVERTMPRYGGRPDSPAYAPQAPGYNRPEVRGAARADDSGYRTRPPQPAPAVTQPAPSAEGRSPEYARPRGYEARPAPSGGGNAPPPAASAPAPNSGFRQAPPQQQAAPSSSGDGRATPRSAPAQGGAQARPRGGRGGV